MDAELERLLKAPFMTRHESALEALLADLADFVPIVGEVAGLARLREAIKEKDDLRIALETGDLVAGFPPIIGDILDILTPTNLILYLAKKK
ncbi:MAG: hypothetical protein QXY41_05980 [Thermoproteota archaeon]